MKNSVIMAFTRAEKPHLFITEFSALFRPCVKRSFFSSQRSFHIPKGGSESSPASAFFFFPIWQKLTIHDYSCQWTGSVWQVSFFFTFVSTNIKNWAYGNILHWSRCPWEDADMLREPVHTCDRLYERKRCKELGEWLGGQDVCLLLNISPYLAFFW